MYQFEPVTQQPKPALAGGLTDFFLFQTSKFGEYVQVENMFVQKGGGDPPPIPDVLDLFPFHTEVMKELEHCRHNACDARRAGRHPTAEVQFPDGLEEVVKWCQNGQVTRGLLKQKQLEPLTLNVYGISIYVHMSFPTSKLNYVACSESICFKPGCDEKTS